MKNMRLADEFGGITGVHRTVMHPYTQDKPIPTQIALVSDKLDKNTDVCVVFGGFGDSKNTDKLEANMVVYIVMARDGRGTRIIQGVYFSRERAQECVSEQQELDIEAEFDGWTYDIEAHTIRDAK